MTTYALAVRRGGDPALPAHGRPRPHRRGRPLAPAGSVPERWSPTSAAARPPYPWFSPSSSDRPGGSSRESARAEARQIITAAPAGNVELLEGTATDTGIPAGSVDVVMLRHVLAHNGTDEQAIVDHLTVVDNHWVSAPAIPSSDTPRPAECATASPPHL